MTDSLFLCRNCRSPLAGINNIPPSPIPHLLGTNKVPSKAETQAILDSIARVELDICGKDAEIARVQLVLDRLIEEREALEEHKNEHAAFLTPARRVPSEIWSEIFLCCLATVASKELLLDYDAPEFTAFNPRNSPALLLRVCRDWTTIVLSSPRLWSLIDLQASSLHPQLSETLVQTWLSRSQEAPLSVIFDTSFLPLHQTISFFEVPATREVVEQSHRWRAVNVTLWLSLTDIFLPLKKHLPELEELHLTFNDDRAAHVPFQGVDLFLNAPKLRLVAIHRTPPFPVTSIKLPWAQLTHFSFDQESEGQSIAVFSTLLHLAPYLLDVDWVLKRYNSQSDSIPSSIVQHSRLCNLSMFLVGDPGSPFASDRISLPSLRTLSIETVQWSASWSPFSLFIAQNHRSLETFRLRSADMHGSLAELVAFLRAMPSLAHLTVAVTTTETAVDELLQALHCTTAKKGGIDDMLLPRMRTIRIEHKVSCNHKDAVGKFVDMVESRWRTPLSYLPYQAQSTRQSHISRLKSASLLLYDVLDFTTDQADSDRVQELRAEGLAVEVSFSHNYESSNVTHL